MKSREDGLNMSVGITDHKVDAAVDSYLGDKPGLLHPSLDFGMLAPCNGDCSFPYTSISHSDISLLGSGVWRRQMLVIIIPSILALTSLGKSV